MIKIGVKGYILDDEKLTNKQMLIIDDRCGSTGGYYIHLFELSGSQVTSAYDTWYETLDMVRRHIKDRGINIKWME